MSLVCHFFKGKEVDWTLMAGTGLKQEKKRERRRLIRVQRDHASSTPTTASLPQLRGLCTTRDVPKPAIPVWTLHPSWRIFVP